MILINESTLQGRITSDIKETMRGAKQNYLTIFFMVQWESEETITKKDGTTFKPSVKIAISAGGKLAESAKGFKKGSLITVKGALRVDSKEDALTKQKTYFPKIEATSIEALVENIQYDQDDELPF